MANTLKFGAGEWAVKEGSALAYNDENGNFKPLPFTFDRSTSATRVNKEGLIEVVSNNEPRIDFLNDSKGALKLEPSRSNAITYSEDFNAVGNNWEKVSMTIEDSDIISPDGTQNAFKLLRPNDTSAAWIRKRPIVVAGQNQVISMFAKSGSNTIFNITYYDVSGGDRFFNFDLSTKVVSGSGLTNDKYVDSGIKDYGNGWFRCYVVIEAGDTNPQIQFAVGTNRGAPPNEYLYVYGPQLESNASYTTSYIPTQGSIGTRVAESCVDAGNEQVINSTEGVLYLNTATLVNTQTTDNSITLTDGGNNKIIFRYRNTNSINVKVFVNGAAQAESNYTLSNATDFNKIAIKWKLNDYEIYVNGISIFTDNNALVFPSNSLNSLNLDDSTSFSLFGKVRDIKLYNTALTDSELQALTTI